MEVIVPEVTDAEREFYGDGLILLEGIVAEFLNCLELTRRWRRRQGEPDLISSAQARIKSAGSMREKLVRKGLPVTAENALHEIRDAAGVRIICPFLQDTFQVAEWIREIPDVTVLEEKDYISHPKCSGYRSYHMILSMPLRISGIRPERPVYLEVQLRTIAMDCWASIEHRLQYKRNIPDAVMIARELRRCADEITSTDLSLQTIRELLENLEEEEKTGIKEEKEEEEAAACAF